ncbi:MAG: hypothetical protein K5636_05200 [Bacteroidales bacterium]|nr:hypothetical protein [Bacteroidales bacterium]
MKKTLLSVLMVAAVLLVGKPAFAQDNSSEQEPKVAYNFINEYGFFLGGFFMDEAIGFNGVFINGVRIQNEVVGIGVGYSTDALNGQSIPLFLNYRHYFKTEKTLKPMINVAVGTNYYFWKTRFYTYTDPNSYDTETHYVNHHGFGLYATMSSGFKVKAFSFSAGLFLRSIPRDKSLCGGLDVKVGYTF